VYPAEVVIGRIQSANAFQIVEFLCEGTGEPRQLQFTAAITMGFAHSGT
jgi:hypothetical protein